MTDERKQAPAIIAISHGPLCSAALESARMIFGELDRVEALPLEEGDDPEEYQARLADLIDSYEGNAVVCCDILGGTPFNSLMALSRDRRLHGVAGLSLGLLLELLANREELGADELGAAALESCAQVDNNLGPMLEKLYAMGREREER